MNVLKNRRKLKLLIAIFIVIAFNTVAADLPQAPKTESLEQMRSHSGGHKSSGGKKGSSAPSGGAMHKFDQSTGGIKKTPPLMKLSVQPGIIAYRGGEWLWSDHLFNLTKNIGVRVEIVSPAETKNHINSEELKKIVKGVFEKAGITPEAEMIAGKAPLPIFHVLILLYPINQGYVFAILARLFESVEFDRVKLDPTVTMQAITWEHESIHVISDKDFSTEIQNSVRDEAQEFVERYAYFEKLRYESKQ